MKLKYFIKCISLFTVLVLVFKTCHWIRNEYGVVGDLYSLSSITILTCIHWREDGWFVIERVVVKIVVGLRFDQLNVFVADISYNIFRTYVIRWRILLFPWIYFWMHTWNVAIRFHCSFFSYTLTPKEHRKKISHKALYERKN